MSYILDALKKSDQERQQNNGPDLQTIHRPRHQHKSGAKVFGLVIGFSIVGVIVSAAVIWYWLDPQTFERPDKPEQKVISSETRPAEKITTAANPPAVQQPPQPSANTAVVNNRSIDSEPLSPVVEFWELPDPIQKAIPALTFSFHVYSDNPERRTIIINKRRVKEGDSIEPRLSLTEITKDGVILQWDKRRFSINVVESW